MTPTEQAAQARQQARYAAEDAVRALTVGSWTTARVALQDAVDLLAKAVRFDADEERIPYYDRRSAK